FSHRPSQDIRYQTRAMPFYEYQCSHCQYYLEVMQKISEAPLRKCPSCGKSTLKKLMSAPVFRLKGSGWYETDFKGDQERKRNLAGEEQAAAEPKGADAAAKPAEGAAAGSAAGAAGAGGADAGASQA